MNDIFINKIHIKKVRHLEDITIDFGEGGRKHMIFTGQNGSGKTSVLEAIRDYLQLIVNNNLFNLDTWQANILIHENAIQKLNSVKSISNIQQQKAFEHRKNIAYYKEQIAKYTKAVNINFKSSSYILDLYNKGEFILAYFNAKRTISLQNPKDIEIVEFKEKYNFQDDASKDFLKYIVTLRAQQSWALENGETQASEDIKKWFVRFEKLLQTIFNDNALKLYFDWRTTIYSLIQKGREHFDFTTLPQGYASLLNIVMELMLRMEKNKTTNYDVQGIVLIDEVDVHLHLDLQKKVLPFLTTFFPNIQFIISTHSPFVLSSVDDAVIYDLENKIQVEDLSKYPYDGIVEGYFKIHQYTARLKEKLALYEQLIKKASLTEKEQETMYELRFYLMKIPEDLAPEIAYRFEELENIRHSKSA